VFFDNWIGVTKDEMTPTKKEGALSLAKRIVAQAKTELSKEREEKLKEQAKGLLEDIQEAKRTTALLERQLRNFMREVDLN
jgi:F0F1-type ATP synthase membrane subunit b/b'